MKRKSAILYVTLGVLFLITAFVVGGASASTGCFTDTNGHWAETFICWMKDNGLSSGYPDGSFHPDYAISRAEVSVLLQKMRTTGDFSFNEGTGIWVPNGSSPNHYVTHFTNAERLRTTVAGSYGYEATITIPSNMYHTMMWFSGVKICYDAIGGGGTITDVYVRHYLSTGDIYHEVHDTTSRTDSGCATFNFTTPGSVYGGEYASVYIVVSTASVSQYVDIHSITAYLFPDSSGTAPVLKEDRSAEVTSPAPGDAP